VAGLQVSNTVNTMVTMSECCSCRARADQFFAQKLEQNMPGLQMKSFDIPQQAEAKLHPARRRSLTLQKPWTSSAYKQRRSKDYVG